MGHPPQPDPPAGGSPRSGGGRSIRGASREQIEQRAYDPRREQRRQASRVALPDDVVPQMLDPEARKELRPLVRETADLVARHLVVAGQLVDDNPEQALVHARAARAMAGRIGVVREAVGLAAYAAGEWAEALSELRTARRITGAADHLAVLADCERALGRPERALGYADDPEVPRLTQQERVELVIVVSGARRDLGQADAAVLMLQEPARRTSDKRPWAVRLWYAYADALLDAGRTEQAREWFERTAGLDVEGATDAGDRLLLLDGIVVEDLGDDDEQVGAELPMDAELAEYVKNLRPAAPQETAVPAEERDEAGPAAEVPASGVLPPPFAQAPPDEAPDERERATPAERPPLGDLRLFD